ncbi:hypothetical protein UlMin_008181 [Ulmus minor]
MANAKEARWVGDGTKNGNVIFEEIVPSARWTADKNGHCLIVDLPDFRKEHVKVQVINSGNIKISGERLANEKRKIHFEKSYKVPENSDTDNITTKFDGGILYVNLPKRVEDEGKSQTRNSYLIETRQVVDEEKSETISKKEEKKSGWHTNPHLSFPKECIKKWEGGEASYLERAMEMLRNNKESIVSAILGFSLGVLLTSKFNREKNL